MANKGTIKKGAKVTLMGNYGTGKFEVKEHDRLTFESGSELNILANNSALYGIRLVGKTKLIVRSDILKLLLANFIQSATKLPVLVKS